MEIYYESWGIESLSPAVVGLGLNSSLLLRLCPVALVLLRLAGTAITLERWDLGT
jgi:hypothetical protein